MERLLARLERRLGRLAIPNLIGFLVGGTAIVWLLSLLRPEFQHALNLDINAVRHGQIWRLVTFLFIPALPAQPSSLIWEAVDLYFTWWVGSSLEQHWGPFKFDVYYALGAIATVAVAIVFGPMTNTWLNWSLVFAFATVFPDVQILLFFVLPIRVKWLGIGAAAAFVYFFAEGDTNERAAIAASAATYALFFADFWWNAARHRRVITRQRSRRAEFEPAAPQFGQRVCAMCGAREAEGADVRVCSCEKCGGKPRTLCLQHARNH
jgi:membrane associated rhomboid family serine protease